MNVRSNTVLVLFLLTSEEKNKVTMGTGGGDIVWDQFCCSNRDLHVQIYSKYEVIKCSFLVGKLFIKVLHEKREDGGQI